MTLTKAMKTFGVRKDRRREVETMSMDSSFEEFNAEESKEMR